MTTKPLPADPMADLHPLWEELPDGSILIRLSAEQFKDVGDFLAQHGERADIPETQPK